MENLRATDLRIGNSVNELNVGVVTVDIVDLEAIKNGDTNYQPIPLTEEWLLKFGFSIEDDYVELDVNEYLSIIWVGYLAIMMEGGINFLNENQTYVHQLQNLYFALTNTELTLINQPGT